MLIRGPLARVPRIEDRKGILLHQIQIDRQNDEKDEETRGWRGVRSGHWRERIAKEPRNQPDAS